MKQRILLIGAVLVFILVIALMVRDMFQQRSVEKNPYEFSLDSFKDIDTNDFCYDMVKDFKDDFQKINAICIGLQDELIIADSMTIKIYDKSLNPIKSFNLSNEITSLHMDLDNRLVIGLGNRMEIWNTDGRKTAEIPTYNDNSIITSITSDGELICAADAGSKKLLLYDKSGDFIRTMGEKDGNERKFGFLIPSPYFDVDISRDGQFWATNPGLHTLEAYDTIGRMISSWKRTSIELDGFSGCCNPTHFALLSDDGFVTCEKGLVRIKIHEPTGDFRCAVAGPLSFDEKETGMDIAVNSQDEIFVAVPSINSIFKYVPKSEI